MIDIGRYIGIPYAQLNCWQLVCRYYRQELGIELPCFSGEYAGGDDHAGIARIYSRELAQKTWPRTDAPRHPDLIVLRIAGRFWHAGIVLGGGRMLHTQRGCNSVVERYRNAVRWKNQIYGFYRYAAA